jgi:uncharacterized protein YndB with AHSA1/START domain
VLTARRQVPASAAAVWAVLTDLDAWPVWGPTVSRATLDADELAVGARGTVWTPVGVPLPFRITEVVPGRRWSWSVAGVPATTHSVEPINAASPTWGSVVSMAAPLWAPVYLPVLHVALRRIERLASR